ncbi:MAG TPA: cation:proton antiporter [Holophagaceae bacterium]|nr:cation:proton antiporter [Holophagaceae bacterium]
MHEVPRLILDLAMVLGVAAVITVACQRLRIPVIMGYLVAGLVVGPHVPIPLVADERNVATLAELGVIFLMFCIGLEFSPRAFLKAAPIAGLVGSLEVGALACAGYGLGRLFGWPPLTCLFAGGVTAISSTMIIAKVFAERPVSERLRRFVLSVLIVEDLCAVLLLTVLTAVASLGTLEPGHVGGLLLRLAGFIAVVLFLGQWGVPRVFRWLGRQGKAELMAVGAMGFCFSLAVLAAQAGFSLAMGAFLAGMLVSESGEGRNLEHLLRAFRDVFAAIFFVSVGMQLDPRLLPGLWLPILAFAGLVMGGKVAAVTLAALAARIPPRTGVEAGLALAQIGEFSFIIAATGMAHGAVRPELFAVAVGCSILTSLATPSLLALGPALGLRVEAALKKGPGDPGPRG